MKFSTANKHKSDSMNNFSGKIAFEDERRWMGGSKAVKAIFYVSLMDITIIVSMP
jgi:hypothetical protein